MERSKKKARETMQRGDKTLALSALPLLHFLPFLCANQFWILFLFLSMWLWMQVGN